MRVPRLLAGPVRYSEDLLFFEVSSYAADASAAMVEVPANTCLKALAALDLTSASAVAGFIERFGYPSGEAGGEGPLWEEMRALWMPFGEEFMPKPLPEWDAALWVQHRTFKGWWAYPLVEFRERAVLVMDLTAVQVYLRGHQTLDELARQWRSSLVPAPTKREHALLLLYLIGNWALSPFQPLFEISALEDGLADPTPRFEHAALRQRPRLFEALFLQLFNDVSAELDYRRCASETCDRWFPITRPDRFYCDMSCARAEAQRQLQRRRSKRWTNAARNYVADARRTSPTAGWAELYEAFARANKGQPYRNVSQLQTACQDDTAGRRPKSGPKGHT